MELVSGIHRLPRHDGFDRKSMYRYVAQEVLRHNKDLLITELRWILASRLQRLTMVDAVKKYADVDFNEISTIGSSRTGKLARGKRHIEFEPAP